MKAFASPAIYIFSVTCLSLSLYSYPLQHPQKDLQPVKAASILKPTPQPISQAFIAFSVSFNQYPSAGEFYRRGERLLKENKIFAAYENFSEASKREPNNEKYLKKKQEIGRAASKLYESEGQEQINTNAKQAELKMQLAVECDASNNSAAQALSLIRNNIIAASAKAREAQGALEKGDLASAEALIFPLSAYRQAVPTIPAIEIELTKAKQRAGVAQVLWEQGQRDKALEALTQAEAESNSIFIKSISEKIRREMADELLRRADALPNTTLVAQLSKLEAIKKAIKIDDTHKQALENERQTSTAIVEAIIGKNQEWGRENKSPSLWRVQLEQLRLIEPIIKSDSRLEREKNRIKTASTLPLRVRIITDNLQGCSSEFSKERIRSVVSESLAGVAVQDERAWDITINLKSFNCSTTYIPKQAVQKINSTYVTGYNQLANPNYLQLQNKIREKQNNLARAENNTQTNGGFAGGIASGMVIGQLRGEIARLQKELENTPPYTKSAVLQQYQYEQFESYRSHQIEARMQVFSREPKQSYSTESTIAVKSEGSGKGIVGVLDQDNTGAINKAPEMPLDDFYSKQSWDKARSKLPATSRDLVAGYFASIALNPKVEHMSRMAALLFLFDLADGTTYENDAKKLKSQVNQALLTNEDAIKAVVQSLMLTVPSQVKFTEDNTPAITSTKTVLEKTLEGVVEIETDSSKGSGFFFTPACLIITNEHVIKGADTIILRTSSRKLLTAQVLAVDATRDLALLKSSAQSCVSLPLGDTTRISIGQDIFAVGNPLGLSGTVTKGIISAIRKLDNGIRYIQVDATINPGSSGGPLISSIGEVLGVNTFKAKGYEGLNFAITSDAIRDAFGKFLR